MYREVVKSRKREKFLECVCERNGESSGKAVKVLNC